MASRLSGRGRGCSSSTYSSMGTSQEPQTSDSTTGSSSTVDHAKRLPGQRGRSFGSKLVRMKSGERHYIQVDAYGRVVAPHYEAFATWIGVIVRCEANAPLMVCSFKDIPEDLKEKMYRSVQEKFVWDEGVDLRDMIISNIKRRYTDYRNNLKKKYYTPFDSDRDRIMHFKGLKDPPIQEETFVWLLRFWESDAHQELSQRNKSNRSKANDDAHRLGRESEAQFIYRETQRRGHVPHRVDVYIESRKGKHDGKFASLTTEQNSEKMMQMRLERGAGSSNASDDQIIENVLGPDRKGEVRFIGHGVTPSVYLGSSSQQRNKRLRTADLVSELRSMQGENNQLKEHLQDLRQECKDMKNHYKEQIEEIQRQQDEQMSWLRRMFNGPSGSQPPAET